jgi:hypothetical protein
MERGGAAADLKRADDLTDIKARTDRLRCDGGRCTDGTVSSTDAQPAAVVLLEEYFDVYSVLLR